jgi:hypothetical protein
MTVTLEEVITSPKSGRNRAVVLDFHDYAQSVILQGREVPWHHPTAYSNFFGQAQGLLKPDVALLDLGTLYSNAVATNEGLRSSLSARSRTGFALKALLANETTAAAAVELATVVSQTSAAPLVLQIPSPMRWLALTHELSGAGSMSDLTSDDAENAAMHVAGWLRRLSQLEVSLLILDERWTGTGGDLPLVDSSAYAPVSNVTANYRWALARRTHEGVDILGSAVTGTVVPQEYWLSDANSVSSGDFLFAEIPPHAVPETVLSQLAKLA